MSKMKIVIDKQLTTLDKVPGCRQAIKEFKEDFKNEKEVFDKLIKDDLRYSQFEYIGIDGDVEMTDAGWVESRNGFDYDFFLVIWIASYEEVKRVHYCVKRFAWSSYEEDGSREYEGSISEAFRVYARKK